MRGLVGGTSSQRQGARGLQAAGLRAHAGKLQGASLVLALRACLRGRLGRPRAVRRLERGEEEKREGPLPRARPDGAPGALPVRRPGHSNLRHPGDPAGRAPLQRAEAVVSQQLHRGRKPPGERRPGARAPGLGRRSRFRRKPDLRPDQSPRDGGRGTRDLLRIRRDEGPGRRQRQEADRQETLLAGVRRLARDPRPLEPRRRARSRGRPLAMDHADRRPGERGPARGPDDRHDHAGSHRVSRVRLRRGLRSASGPDRRVSSIGTSRSAAWITWPIS